MTNGNESAFPMFPQANLQDASEGLTKREYFAALAMQGLLANDWSKYKNEDADCFGIASVAINYADALIAELNKTNNHETI